MNDDKLISGGSFGLIKIWKIDTAECLKTLSESLKTLIGHAFEITSIKVILSNKIVSGACDEIKVWDVESGTCLKTLNIELSDHVNSIIQLSHEQIASGDSNGRINYLEFRRW